MTDFLTTGAGRRLGYVKTEGKGPGIVFLAGLKSDMEGTKAVHLETWARAQGRAFLRFDYSGHGVSSGRFEDGCIGDWAADAREVVERLTDGPQVLVGSSMGGWISLILAREIREKISGIVGIAAAPDFTEDGFWAGFDADQRAELMEKGRVFLPSEYEEPYLVTRRLIEEGRRQLVLRAPLELRFPTRLLQGDADSAVALSVPLRLLEQARGDDIRLTIVKGADHRFSTQACLDLIETSIDEVIQAAGGA